MPLIISVASWIFPVVKDGAGACSVLRPFLHTQNNWRVPSQRGIPFPLRSRVGTILDFISASLLPYTAAKYLNECSEQPKVTGDVPLSSNLRHPAELTARRLSASP